MFRHIWETWSLILLIRGLNFISVVIINVLKRDWHRFIFVFFILNNQNWITKLIACGAASAIVKLI